MDFRERFKGKIHIVNKRGLREMLIAKKDHVITIKTQPLQGFSNLFFKSRKQIHELQFHLEITDKKYFSLYQ